MIHGPSVRLTLILSLVSTLFSLSLTLSSSSLFSILPRLLYHGPSHLLFPRLTLPTALSLHFIISGPFGRISESFLCRSLTQPPFAPYLAASCALSGALPPLDLVSSFFLFPLPHLSRCNPGPTSTPAAVPPATSLRHPLPSQPPPRRLAATVALDPVL